MENGGNKHKAALKAGYSPAMAKNPKRIEETKGFKQLLDFYFPDDFLLKEHKKNIKQSQDKGAKNKAIDMAYRLKSRYPSETAEIEDSNLRIVIKKK